MNRMLFTLALRNVLRQKVRTAMTLTAIAFGVAGLILSGGFIKDIFVQLGEAIIHSQTGHIQIFEKDFLDKGSRKPEKYLIADPAEVARQIATIDAVEEVSARLNFTGLLNNGRRDLAIIGEGIEAEKETRLGTYLSITEGRQLKDSDSFGLLAGQGVAHSLGLKPGDHVTLVLNTADGALNSIELEVIGIFQSFSKDFDARAIRIPLAAARELLLTEGANLLVVTLTSTEATDEAYAKIGQQIGDGPLDTRHWRQLSDFYDKTIQLYDRQFGVLEWIIMFMVLLSVVNSINMSTFERQSEFGTLRALGNRPRDVFRMLMAEGLVLGVGGASIGVLVGILIAAVVSAIGIPMPPPPNANVGYTAFIRIVPEILAKAWLIGLVATVLAAMLPARRTVKTPIVDALRQGV